MIRVFPREKRHSADLGWLKTHWLFSFSDYYDPENVQHGELRVFNDDIIMPGAGFPAHSHKEMEIVTIVLEGELTHKDSMGNAMVIRAGDVQRMSAGKGVVHSEYNLAETPVHLFQIWIFPGSKGLPATYDQRHFDRGKWRDRLFPLVNNGNESVKINADAAIYRCALSKENSVPFTTTPLRKILLYVSAGELQVNGQILHQWDQARIEGESSLEISAMSDAEFILVDVP